MPIVFRTFRIDIWILVELVAHSFISTVARLRVATSFSHYGMAIVPHPDIGSAAF